MNTFNLLGDIVQDDSQRLFESDVIPAMVIGWLAKQEGDVEININSLGGSVTGGLAIANAFKGYSKGKVTANVLGIAASMASVVACAADEIRMGKGAFMMVHNPWTIALGDANDLRKEADTLDQIKASIIAFYQSKFDCDTAKLSEIMDAETWIADTDAETYGLKCTALAAEDDAFGKLAAKCDTRMLFAKAPAAARAFYSASAASTASADEGTTPAGRQEGTAPEVSSAPAEETAEASAQIETPQAATEAQTPEVKSQASSSPAHDTKSGGEWEARYKGASRKITELQDALAKAGEASAAALADAETKHQAAIKDLNDQLSAVRGDLEKAKADLSSAVNRAEKAEKDLADKGEQLDRLTKAHALLTGGVLTPGDGSNAETEYQSELNAAKSAEQREEIRRKHHAKATKKTN